MAPRFSVVIDNHNYGRFLRAAIDSALSQEAPGGLELIVVDDGSTDDSREIIASYGGRVRPILQPRLGQAAAFNAGCAAATGELVCLLDSDDVWLPGKITAVSAAFEHAKVACVQHLLLDTDAELKPLPRRRPGWPERYRLEDLLAGRLVLTATSGLSFRREALQRCLPLPESIFYYLDDYLTVRSLFFGEIANVGRVLGYHRVHGGNWCAGGYEDPLKIERDFANRAIFMEARERWLREAGLSLSDAARAAESLELFRRRVLLAALRGRRREALSEWRRGRAELSGLPGSSKRVWSTLLAVLSPSLYLGAYRAYSGAGARLDKLS